MAKTKTFQERAGLYEQDIEKIAKKHKVTVSIGFGFPKRKSVPLLSRIAMFIMSIQGGVVMKQVSPRKK